MNARPLPAPVRPPVALARPAGPDGPPGVPPPGPARWIRAATALAGLVALTAYLLSSLAAPGAHWPLWDVHVYWWGGQQAVRGGALYAPGARYSFTYPPFAAALFGLAAPAPEGVLAAVLTAASVGALAVLCALSLGLTGVRRRPETVFAVTALALLTWPVAYTLRLGEINLIVAALAGADLLRRRDGHRGQGIATGLAAGIKLTPLIFIAYLLITGRVRAAATAVGAFAATVAVGAVLLPSSSRVFWLDGVFYNQNRVGDPANSSDQSLSGAIARLAGSLDPGHRWWAVAALLTGLAGITVAAWAHRRGRRLAGVTGCALTGLLISPFSWTHHWVWAVPLLVALAARAWRRRSAWYGLAALTTAAVFSRRVPLSWPGHPPGLIRLLEGDLYVLCGLAVLAGMALVLVREQAGVRPARRLPLTPRGHPRGAPPAQAGRARRIISFTDRSEALMVLHPGDKFPALTVARAGGGFLPLPDALAGHFGVVLFYRGSWCPYCNAQLRAFQRAKDDLAEVGARVVALSVDDEAATADLIAQHGLEFAVGYGADARAVAAATGAFVNDDPVFLQSTGFVLNPAGQVVTGVYSTGAIGRLVPGDVTGLIRYLRAHAA